MSDQSSHHVKVLLWKNWLILRRNWLFMIMFIMLPILMMSGFWYLETCLDAQFQEEKHNLEFTRYSKIDIKSKSFLNSGMSNRIGSYSTFKSNLTAMGGCQYGSRKELGLIAPKNLTNGYEKQLTEEFSKFSNLNFLERHGKLNLHIFENIEDLFLDIKTNKTHKYCFAFQLTDVRPKIDEVNITIFFPRDDLTGLINTYTPLFDLSLKNPDWLRYNMTFLYGTPHFMVSITDFLLLLLNGHRTKELELAFIPMKTAAFKDYPPSSASALSMTFPIFFICVFLLPLYYMVTKLAEEKESKTREGMNMMGLTNNAYYKSWFIFNACIVFFTSLLIVGVLQIEIFTESSKVLMLTMCFLYGTQIFGFSFTIVAILPSKKASATAATILHLSTYYIVYLYKGYGSSIFQKALIACLVPNCSLGFMLDHLVHCEIEGGTPLNYQTALLPYQSFNFMLGLACQFTCSFIWAFTGVYLDRVMPREFGKAEPWNFLCKSNKKQQKVNLSDEIHDPRLIQLGNFEKESEFIKKNQCLQIRNLKKQYDNGFIAVQNESMTIYKGQIFALLGHNGAGKTTTISMLTGLVEPTEGCAIIDGINIFDDMKTFRTNLGVCPQHNVLFETLTVREHLELFCSLKGKQSEFEMIRKVDKMIRQIELDDVQFQIAGTLSGGQKRKLSVGIALIGDAKIVLLDEPTSGMDTTTRRRFWEMIKQYKEDRIIILTTHYMDEADVLGDRICIMAEGVVQCCGSALFLKNRFGVGYNLKLVKTNQTNSQEVQNFVSTQLKEAKFQQEVQNEIIWQLPESARKKFKQFFTNLDQNLTKLKLKSYGVTITSLEDVFLKIGHGENDNKGSTIEQIRERTADLSKLNAREKQLVEYSISQDNHKNFTSELLILMKKKILVQVRDVKSCLMDILLPCIMIFVGIYISKLEIIPAGHPSRNLSLYDFPNQIPLVHNHANFNQTSEELEEFFEYGFQNDIGQEKLWSKDVPIKLNTSAPFFEQIREMDNYLFDSRNQSGPYFAEIFIQNVDRDTRNYSIASLVNTSQPSAALSAGSYMLQAVMRSELENPNFKLNFFEAQLPFGMEWQVYINTGVGTLSSLGFAIAYMMISDTLIQSLIKEKQLAIKHQIIISGGSKLAYWLSHYILDFITHSIPALLTCTTIQRFEVDVPQIEYLFLWFCIINPLFIYSIQLVMKNDGQASVFIRVFYFAMGGVAPIAMQVLQVVNKDTTKVADYLKQYFKFVPIYNINYGYISISNRNIIEALNKLPKDTLSPLDWQCAGEALYMLQLAGIISFLILICAENNVFQLGFRPMLKPIITHLEMIHLSTNRKKVRKAYLIQKLAQMEDIDFQKQDFVQQIKDQDPLAEENRVKNNQSTALKVENLTKAYTPFHKAVDNISFGLDYGECFALLGITGAGKTTTFKCLCQEEIPDQGTMIMAGHNIRSTLGFASARQMIGYCPQFDALFDQLTVKEHLYFYATIKGVRHDYKTELVARAIKELDLFDYTNTYAGKLSGGNKRKLSCAIALIGNPPIVLLDEPSTGVDPQAKRFMWSVISNISTLRKQSTVILTTHSMEEAEALCPKMGIMVDGKFQCFGSAQHIKDKYADGFDIDLKINDLNQQALFKLISGSDLTPNTYVNDQDSRNILELLGMQIVWETQITNTGNTLKKILRQESPFLLDEVLRWAHIEYKGQGLINKLCSIFGQCDVIDHYSNRFNLKVARNKYSIGFVFGVMEELKQEFEIDSFTATQTTLEQIFNMFAKQKGIKNRHESLQ